MVICTTNDRSGLIFIFICQYFFSGPVFYYDFLYLFIEMKSYTQFRCQLIHALCYRIYPTLRIPCTTFYVSIIHEGV